MIKKVKPEELRLTIKRVKVTILAAPGAAPDGVGDTPAPPAPTYNPTEYNLRRMLEDNPEKAPLILALIGRFDLVDEITGYPLNVPPADQGRDHNETPQPASNGKPKRSLEEIAADTFEQEKTYTLQEALDALTKATNTTRERAAAGLAAMEAAGILARAGDGLYLASSTPF